MYTFASDSGGELRRRNNASACTVARARMFTRSLTVKLALVILFFSFSWAQADGIDPAAMNRPALMSARAPSSTLLAVTTAGDNLVAAGERGIILVSKDNGKSWQQAKVPTSANLTALTFVDAKRGWAVGHMGVVLNTEDGGMTWHKQLDGIEAGRLAVIAVSGSDNQRAIKLANYLVKDGPDKPFFDVTMDADGHGFIVGAFNLMFRTDDGGEHWRYWSPRVKNRFGLHLYDIARLGNDFYLAGEQGLLLRSQDGGEHFDSLESPYEGSWFGLLASSNGSLLAYGLRGNAFMSLDRGETWQSSNTGSQVSFVAARELSDGRIVLANQAGQLFASNDQGKSFKPLQGLPGTPFTSLTQTASGELVLSSLRGLTHLPVTTLANSQ
jgi:photosystem II stability/assembly factor-like uncharacterized protein